MAEEEGRRLWCFEEVGCLFVLPRSQMSNQVMEAQRWCERLRSGGRLVGQSKRQQQLCQKSILRRIEEDWADDVLMDARGWSSEEGGKVAFVWNIDQEEVDGFQEVPLSWCGVEEGVLLMREGQLVLEMCPSIKKLVVCAFPCEAPLNLSAVSSEEECSLACLDNPPCNQSSFSPLCTLSPLPPHLNNTLCSTHFGELLVSGKSSVERQTFIDKDKDDRAAEGEVSMIVVLVVSAFLLLVISVCLCYYLLSQRGQKRGHSTKVQQPLTGISSSSNDLPTKQHKHSKRQLKATRSDREKIPDNKVKRIVSELEERELRKKAQMKERRRDKREVSKSPKARSHRRSPVEPQEEPEVKQKVIPEVQPEVKPEKKKSIKLEIKPDKKSSEKLEVKPSTTGVVKPKAKPWNIMKAKPLVKSEEKLKMEPKKSAERTDMHKETPKVEKSEELVSPSKVKSVEQAPIRNLMEDEAEMDQELIDFWKHQFQQT